MWKSNGLITVLLECTLCFRGLKLVVLFFHNSTWAIHSNVQAFDAVLIKWMYQHYVRYFSCSYNTVWWIWGGNTFHHPLYCFPSFSFIPQPWKLAMWIVDFCQRRCLSFSMKVHKPVNIGPGEAVNNNCEKFSASLKKWVTLKGDWGNWQTPTTQCQY